MKHYLAYILLILIGTANLTAEAQQMTVFTQNQSAILFQNPSYAGLSEGICVNGLMRQQWAGFKDTQRGDNLSPQIFLVSVDSPIKLLHGGLGLAIVQDNLAADQWQDIGVQISYSFHADLSFAKLGIGAGVSLINRNFDGSKYDPVTPGDEALNTSTVSDMRADVNFGLFLKDPGHYYFGIGVINMLESNYKKLDPSGNDEGVINDRTFTLNAAYTFVLSNPLFEIEPSLMVLSDIVTTQYNLTALVNYNDRFWGGLNARLGGLESIGVLIGVSFKAFRVGYSYDINLMGLSMPGSHEVSFSYCFKIKTDRSKTTYKNTRYL